MSAPQWFRWDGSALEIRVLVQTRCHEEGPGEVVGDALKVRVSAAPVEGRANQRLLAVLAKAFGVAKSRVQVIRGVQSRRKWVRVEQPRRLPPALESAAKNRFQVDQTPKGV